MPWLCPAVMRGGDGRETMEVGMNKPLVNIDDVQFNDIEENGFYTSRRALQKGELERLKPQ